MHSAPVYTTWQGWVWMYEIHCANWKALGSVALQAGTRNANKAALSGRECQQPAASVWQASASSQQQQRRSLAGEQAGRPHLRKTMRLFFGMKMIVSSHTCSTAGTAQGKAGEAGAPAAAWMVRQEGLTAALADDTAAQKSSM